MRKFSTVRKQVGSGGLPVNVENTQEELHRMGVATEEERARVKLWAGDLPTERFLIEEEKIGDLAQNRILSKLERYGICQVRPVGLPATRELVDSIIHLIGAPTHEQNEAKGPIKDIRPNSEVKPISGNSSGDLGFHVDGTQAAAQPPILLFQYVTGAVYGAHNRFADTARILHDFTVAERSRLLRKLSRPDAAVFTKGNYHFAGPIFSFSATEALMCRIRFDEVINVNDACVREFNKLKSALSDPYYSITLQPRDGDLVLIDNWRILHARTEVYGTRARHHRRVWFANLKLEHQVKYFLGIRPISRALIARIHAGPSSR